jgi:hypothetical protein
MFRDLGPLPNLALPALLGVIGVAAGGWAGWWIERRIRTRRLTKLGFSADDLRSKERIFKKWGEIAIGKIPEKISFSETPSHSWSDPSKHNEAKAAFKALGFREGSMFIASPQKWVVEFWLSSEPGLIGKILDSPQRGIYSEVTIANRDGSAFSFENTEHCGFRHREPDHWVHCGLISPAELVERALRQRQPNDVRQISLAESVSAYEQSVNEFLAWRRSVGFNAEEVEHMFEHSKKRHSHA